MTMGLVDSPSISLLTFVFPEMLERPFQHQSRKILFYENNAVNGLLLRRTCRRFWHFLVHKTRPLIDVDCLGKWNKQQGSKELNTLIRCPSRRRHNPNSGWCGYGKVSHWIQAALQDHAMRTEGNMPYPLSHIIKTRRVLTTPKGQISFSKN